MTEQSIQPQPSVGTRRRGWSAGRTIGVVVGAIAALVGALMALGGAGVIAAHFTVRDDDGFYTSGDERLAADGYAITTENIDLGNATDTAPDELLGRLRVTIQSQSESAGFAGIAPRAQVESYLEGVQHSVLTDIDEPEYREVDGNARPGRPAAQAFWAAQAEGEGEQVLEWDIEGGNWSVVFLNADAKPGVDVDASVGIEIDWLIWVGVGLVVVGLLIAGGGIALIVVMRREAAQLI